MIFRHRLDNPDKEVISMKVIRSAAQAALVKTGRLTKSVPGNLS